MTCRITAVAIGVVFSITATAANATAQSAGIAEVEQGIASVVPVRPPGAEGFPVASLMRADCDVVVRVQHPDGSATEHQSCRLNDAPVMIAENQGRIPSDSLTFSGGPCEWTSDLLWARTGVEAKAATWELTVTPTGRAFAVATYPAAPLDCEVAPAASAAP